jgi:hypothetical protein
MRVPLSSLTLTSSGNLVLHRPTTTNTVTATAGDASLLAVSNASNLILWATRTATPQYAGSELASGQTLEPNQYLQSSNGLYELFMSPNGSLVVVDNGANACPSWMEPSSIDWVPYGNKYNGTLHWYAINPPVPGSALTMQSTDGNLVLYTPSGAAPWASGTTGYPGDYLVMQSDGNLVIYTTGGGAPWATGGNTTLGSALCDGETMTTAQHLSSYGYELGLQYYELEFATDGNKGMELNTFQWFNQAENKIQDVSHLWSDSSSPSGIYLVEQSDGNLVIYPTAGGSALWATGTNGYGGAFAALGYDGYLWVVDASWSSGVWTETPLWTSNPGGIGKAIGKAQEIMMDP